MDINAAIEIAKNPESSAEELAPLVGLDDEVDRLLSKHPYVSADAMRELIWLCPTVFFLNPSLGQLMLDDPSLLEFTGEKTLAHPDCPESILRWVAENGEGMEQKLGLLMNPNTPEDVRKMLTPDKLYQAAMDRLQRYADAQENPAVKKCIEIYSEFSLPYCLPQFLPIDRANPAHRYDDMVGGFPYTSKPYPWPICEQSIYKQPIVQINLERAGELLGEDLGAGLLQVWGNVRVEGWKMGEGWPFEKSLKAVQTRIIPKSALAEPPDMFYPLDAPWDIPDEQLDMCAFHVCLMRLENDHILNPRINWIRFGQMFLNPTYLVTSSYHPQFRDDWDDLYRAFAEWNFRESMQDLYFYGLKYIPHPEAPFIPRGTYLGGFGGGHGGQNEPFPLQFSDGTEGRLLFNTVSDGDSYSSVTLAVFFKRDEREEIQFETTYYHYA